MGAGRPKGVAAPYIVQERIVLPYEPLSQSGGRTRAASRIACWTRARSSRTGESVDGCLTRLSTDALLNVTAGGGSTVPTFVVEKR